MSRRVRRIALGRRVPRWRAARDAVPAGRGEPPRDGDATFSTTTNPAGARSYARRIAVLPFENLGGTPDDERLARGFWQDVIAELSRFPALGVVAADSTGAVRSSGTVEAVAGGPGRNRSLVTGSIRRSGGVIRVGAQLSDARNGRQLWAERFDRPGEEVLDLQDDITARVANALLARIDRQSLWPISPPPVGRRARRLRGMATRVRYASRQAPSNARRPAPSSSVPSNWIPSSRGATPVSRFPISTSGAAMPGTGGRKTNGSVTIMPARPPPSTPTTSRCRSSSAGSSSTGAAFPPPSITFSVLSPLDPTTPRP